MNKPDDFSPRLDMIETRWTMLQRAHRGTMISGGEARNDLVMSYSAAIRSYVGKLVGNDPEASDLSQEFVVRMLNGDFAGADATKGRFRDLLKVAIKNMVRNHWARQKVRKTVDYEPDLEHGKEDDSKSDAEWSRCFRDNVLELAWAQLKNYETENKPSIAFRVLRLRVDNPKFSSTQLAEEISEQTKREINAATYRQQLRRARVRFAEFVVEEIASALELPEPERIREELVALGLYEFIKDVLPSGWGTS